jgi:hypothetical protein
MRIDEFRAGDFMPAFRRPMAAVFNRRRATEQRISNGGRKTAATPLPRAFCFQESLPGTLKFDIRGELSGRKSPRPLCPRTPSFPAP